jgi:hypothetical protein
MKLELDTYLKIKFPKLYTECGGDEPFALFGFECQDGWFRPILWLSRYLQSYIDQQNKSAEKYPDDYLPVVQIKVVQVKEKFGTLRFYVEGGNQHTQAVITFVEYMSGFICETTGQTENVGYNKSGWIKTHHKSLAKGKDFYGVDDTELQQILSNQTEFNFDSPPKK